MSTSQTASAFLGWVGYEKYVPRSQKNAVLLPLDLQLLRLKHLYTAEVFMALAGGGRMSQPVAEIIIVTVTKIATPI